MILCPSIQQRPRHWTPWHAGRQARPAKQVPQNDPPPLSWGSLGGLVLVPPCLSSILPPLLPLLNPSLTLTLTLTLILTVYKSQEKNKPPTPAHHDTQPRPRHWTPVGRQAGRPDHEGTIHDRCSGGPAWGVLFYSLTALSSPSTLPLLIPSRSGCCSHRERASSAGNAGYILNNPKRKPWPQKNKYQKNVNTYTGGGWIRS